MIGVNLTTVPQKRCSEIFSKIHMKTPVQEFFYRISVNDFL